MESEWWICFLASWFGKLCFAVVLALDFVMFPVLASFSSRFESRFIRRFDVVFSLPRKTHMENPIRMILNEWFMGLPQFQETSIYSEGSILLTFQRCSSVTVGYFLWFLTLVASLDLLFVKLVSVGHWGLELKSLLLCFHEILLKPVSY